MFDGEGDGLLVLGEGDGHYILEDAGRAALEATVHVVGHEQQPAELLQRDLLYVALLPDATLQPLQQRFGIHIFSTLCVIEKENFSPTLCVSKKENFSPPRNDSFFSCSHKAKVTLIPVMMPKEMEIGK